MLILLATQRLTPTYGAGKAASIAVALYILHNIVYAAFAFIAGQLADRFPKNILLALAYALAALMALCIIALPANIPTLAVVFILAGISVAIGETLEDVFCAELITDEHHGMAFGVLATVNGIGDFASSIIVGALWTAIGPTAAFSYSLALSLAGTILILQIGKPATSSASH
jgi:MFS family permease